MVIDPDWDHNKYLLSREHGLKKTRGPGYSTYIAWSLRLLPYCKMGIELPCTHRSLLDESHYQMHTSSANKISQITVITAANRNFLVIPNRDSNLNNGP